MRRQYVLVNKHMLVVVRLPPHILAIASRTAASPGCSPGTYAARMLAYAARVLAYAARMLAYAARMLAYAARMLSYAARMLAYAARMLTRCNSIEDRRVAGALPAIYISGQYVSVNK
jgi:hypothetical protein